jgi:DNA-directed RNA polymerase specialized sigma24 family protein
VGKELQILGERHDVWQKYVMSFGCNPDTAEDIVMEMYIKLEDYIERTGNKILFNEKDEPNYFFVYITLRNMIFDLKRKEKRVHIDNIDDYDLTELEVFKPKELDLEMFRVIEDYLLDDDYINICTDENINYNPEQFGKFYKRKIFEEIFIKGVPITQFSRETGITYYSVYNTIRNIKKELQNEYQNRRLDSDVYEVDGY